MPFVVKKTLMKKTGDLFAKFIFWLENMLYLLVFFLYELVLIPFIFFRVIYNILRMADVVSLVPLLFIWLGVGPLFLFFGVFKDMFLFVKILCDYQDEED